MIPRQQVLAARPRDALLKDRRGEVWAGTGDGDGWVPIVGGGPTATTTWFELATELGWT